MKGEKKVGKWIKERKPLTEIEVYEFLSKKVEQESKHWGEDNYYTRLAKETRDKKMKAFRNGEVVEVWHDNYSDSWGNGTGDFEDVLYSDGSVKTICYGYCD